MNETKKQDEKVINLSDLFKKIWKNKILVIIITVAITVLGAIYSFVIAKPKYSSTTSFIVVASNVAVDPVDGEIDYNSIESLRAIPTILSLVTEKAVLEEAINVKVKENATDAEGHSLIEYYPNITVAQVGSMVSVSNEENSLVISISVTCGDRQKAQRIANALVEGLKSFSQKDETVQELRVKITQTSKANLGVYTSPNKPLYIIISFVGGLVISFIVVFFKEFASNKFKTKEEIETILDTKIIGFFVDDESKKVTRAERKNGIHQSFDLLPANLINYEPYNNLFTNIKYSDLEHPNKVIMVTSSLEGELKSTILANLAGCIKNNNQKVVIIDLDMRKPVQHKFFKVLKEKGVVEYIEGSCSLDEVIKRTESGVDVITTGKKILNPVVVLEHSGLGKLIEQLKERYDYILIDSPPVMVCSDSILISKHCDGVVFNVTMNEVRKKDAKTAVDRIKLMGTRVIGINVTKGSVEEGGSKYYYKKYGYSYSEKKEDASKGN